MTDAATIQKIEEGYAKMQVCLCYFYLIFDFSFNIFFIFFIYYFFNFPISGGRIVQIVVEEAFDERNHGQIEDQKDKERRNIVGRYSVGFV